VHLFDEYKHEISVGKDILMNSLRSISELLNPEDNYRLTFQIEDKKLSLYSDLVNFSYTDTVEFDGKFSMDVNGKYFMSTVESIMDDRIIIRFSDEDKSAIKMDSFNFGNQRSLVTPLKKR
jgi:DNA polymerase III sliding clamp (beta) subunit (PCNA family)